MTNEDIIFAQGQHLAEAGKIKYTGRVFQLEDAAGNKFEVKETEPIHTFAAWNELGFKVQKGQKAVAKFSIWKYSGKINEETGEEEGHMFMKNAAFFSLSQVEAKA